jgi:hypothetical protein
MRNIFPQNRRGYFYSLDAFIALLIIFAVVLFIRPQTIQAQYDSDIQEDILLVLSNLKIGEMNDTYVEGLINNDKVTNLDQSVLEQIGEFYANSSSEADALAQHILDDLDLHENIGIYFNDELIANLSSIDFPDARSVTTSRQIISGIQQGSSARGFSSRAFLFAENKIEYFYFGGYIGDGNISVRVEGDMIGGEIEGVFSRNFDLYINGVNVGNHAPSANVPYAIDLTPYSGVFVSGVNNLNFKSSENLYVAGGYIKILYNETQALTSSKKKFFPGIEGLINLYDSFYVPGSLNSMHIYLHYNSSFDIFMTVGDTEIYRGNSGSAETSVNIDNTALSNNLTYSDLSNETIPYRLGLHNVSYVVNLTKDADVMSVTDLSGSMMPRCLSPSGACCAGYDCDQNETLCENICGGTFITIFGFTWCSGDNVTCCNSYGCYTNQDTCETCSGIWEDKIGSAKEANKVFINAVLESSGNRVGLVGYDTVARAYDFHALSNDNLSLFNVIDTEWDAGGMTCICCGINDAVDELVANSDDEKYRSIVVMSDGNANYECTPHREDWTEAPRDAIDAACDAYNDYGIVTHAVAFGADADSITLQNITCGQGNFHQGDVDELVEIYEQIAQEIINASYSEQTIVAGNISTKLYPDSYIEIDYDKEIPYGMLIVSETEDFGNNISQGSFYVPSDSQVYEVQAISYSGSKWTSLVEINDTVGWTTVFNLSEYNSTYIELGDPYAVNIPPELVEYGDNEVRIQVGLSSSDSQGGSEYNKVIYSLIKNISSYSPILSSAEGCTWHIEFEDSSVEQVEVPKNYTGSDDCYYNSTIPSPHAQFNNNDAVEYAIYLLLVSLDLDGDGKIETKFTEQDLSITSIEIAGIPFTWDTEVQARAWV